MLMAAAGQSAFAQHTQGCERELQRHRDTSFVSRSANAAVYDNSMCTLREWPGARRTRLVLGGVSL